MIRNFLLIAWRGLFRNKTYGALNILGLATGMSVALIIGLWAWHQHSYDDFWPDKDRIYQAWNRYEEDEGIDAGTAIALPLAEELRRSFPQVEYAALSDWMGPHGLMVGNTRISVSGGMVEKDFLHIFRLTFLQGNAATALDDPKNIVLSQSTAKALFGTENPMGKVIRVDNMHDVKVSGIVSDLPARSTLSFTFLMSFEHLKQSRHLQKAMTDWRDKSYQCFLKLKPGVTAAAMEIALNDLQKRTNPEDYKLWKVRSIIHSIKDWHLYNDYNNEGFTGLIVYVRMFSLIGALILLIACINFMNLSTAHSEKRAREVGVRKALGSARKSLVAQFLCEAMLMAMLAFLVSLLIVSLVLPYFNQLTGQDVGVAWTSPFFWAAMAAYVFVTGLLAGLKPAFYLSSFQPVKVLKGTFRSATGGRLSRRILVVLQFTSSVALIIGTVIIYQQIEHAKNRPRGYDDNRLVMTFANEDLRKNYVPLKNDLLQSGLVESVTLSSSPVTDVYANFRVDDWQGKSPGESLVLQTIAVGDDDFFSTTGMKILEGRNFTGNTSADSLLVIINEAAVKRMRFTEPLGQVITWHDEPQQIKVIGVVKDALMGSPFTAPEPAVFIYAPQWGGVITYKLSAHVASQTALTNIRKLFEQYNPSSAFYYQFADQTYAAKFKVENLVGKLAGLFAVLAILISCLGLFGLAAFVAEQRTREIGIRKVLGANASAIWRMICSEFVLLVFISCLIATPLAYYFAAEWLKQYAFRINIDPMVFVLSAFAALLIALATVTMKALRAALQNPVNSLRIE